MIAGTGIQRKPRASAEDEPIPLADHGRGLRRARGSGRRPADAGDTLPRQAGGRTGQGEGDGEDSEGLGGPIHQGRHPSHLHCQAL